MEVAYEQSVKVVTLDERSNMESALWPWPVLYDRYIVGVHINSSSSDYQSQVPLLLLVELVLLQF